MDFFTLLKEEHQEAKDTFKKLSKQEPADTKLAETLCKKLLLHMEMEEKYFYPKMEAIKEAEHLAIESKLEHQEAKKQIQALLKGSLDEIETKVKLETLQLEIEHHVEEEETEVFPLARKYLSKEDVQKITEQMLALKEKSMASIGK